MILGRAVDSGGVDLPAEGTRVWDRPEVGTAGPRQTQGCLVAANGRDILLGIRQRQHRHECRI
jgi:hypothetical protein